MISPEVCPGTDPIPPIVQRALSREAGIDERDEHGKTALMKACRYAPEYVPELLAMDASLDVVDNLGRTALLSTMDCADATTIARLLTAGSYVNVPDFYGNTALMLASWRGDVNIIDRLLAVGADINAKSNMGYTALIFAAYASKDDVVRHLIRAGADIHVCDRNNQNLLMNYTHNPTMAKLLLDMGADMNVVSTDGDTPYTRASDECRHLFDAAANLAREE